MIRPDWRGWISGWLVVVVEEVGIVGIGGQKSKNKTRGQSLNGHSNAVSKEARPSECREEWKSSEGEKHKQEHKQPPKKQGVWEKSEINMP